MARVNQRTVPIQTHEGGTAKRIGYEAALRRSVMACMLWEKEFYENGKTIADRIKDLSKQVEDSKIYAMAVEARQKQHLRHVPLLLACALAEKRSKFTRQTVEGIIERADELAELLAVYWKDGKKPIPSAFKKGLATAFTKFNEYHLSKYNRDNAIKLRDVLFLCHAVPKDKEQAKLWKRLVDNELFIPDTWETNLSAGADKKETFTRLMEENKLGAMAFLRNLRNMIGSGVSPDAIRSYGTKVKADKVLPFRFIAAAKYAPQFEDMLESMMFRCLEDVPKLKGKTFFLIDVSGSMDDSISSRSDLERIDAACGLGMLIREVAEQAELYTFSNNVVAVPPRRGFALAEAIVRSQSHGGTYLGQAVKEVSKKMTSEDRIIVITDEQTADSVMDIKNKNAYIVNVASNKNGVGYGAWTHIDGWSEAVIDYIMEFENLNKED